MAEQIQEAYPTFTPDVQNDPFLLADFDTLKISQQGYTDDRTLELQIMDDHGKTYTLTEVYTPVNGLTTIHDIHELLRPYFNRSDIPGLTGFGTTGMKYENQRVVNFQVRQYDGESLMFAKIYSVVYTDTPSGYIHVGTSGIGSRFLTRESEQKVGSDQYAAVSWFPHDEILKVKLLHYVGKVPTLTLVNTYGTGNGNDFCTFNFTLHDLAEIVDVDIDDVIYADLQLFTVSGTTETLRDSVRFMHDRGHRAYERTFAFIGPMGEPEFVAMTGRELREAEFEGTFLMEHHNYRKADTKLNKIHTSYTGPLTEGGRDLIWDMAASPWVYTIEAGQLVEVTITEVELTDSSPHTEPVGLTVKWRYADEYRQRTFKRTPHTPHLGVFDETFDETFE